MLRARISANCQEVPRSCEVSNQGSPVCSAALALLETSVPRVSEELSQRLQNFCGSKKFAQYTKSLESQPITFPQRFSTSQKLEATSRLRFFISKEQRGQHVFSRSKCRVRIGGWIYRIRLARRISGWPVKFWLSCGLRSFQRFTQWVTEWVTGWKGGVGREQRQNRIPGSRKDDGVTDCWLSQSSVASNRIRSASRLRPQRTFGKVQRHGMSRDEAQHRPLRPVCL